MTTIQRIFSLAVVATLLVPQLVLAQATDDAATTSTAPTTTKSKTIREEVKAQREAAETARKAYKEALPAKRLELSKKTWDGAGWC